MYIAVPLSLEAEKTGDLFKHPELFYRVRIHWTIAKSIAESPFGLFPTIFGRPKKDIESGNI
jgi:hypothetical protein